MQNDRPALVYISNFMNIVKSTVQFRLDMTYRKWVLYSPITSEPSVADPNFH
jgi:hypothetical protein